jgi:hypothetical protein
MKSPFATLVVGLALTNCAADADEPKMERDGAGGNTTAGTGGNTSAKGGTSSASAGGGSGSTASSAGEAGGGSAGSAGNDTSQGGSNAGSGGNVQGGAGGEPTDLPKELALRKTSYADSWELLNPPSNGNDGNGTTRWCPNGATPAEGRWWGVDLTAEHPVTQINIRWEFFEARAVYRYKIESCSGSVTRTTRNSCLEGAQLCADLKCEASEGWKLLVDKTAEGSTSATKEHELPLTPGLAHAVCAS